MKLTRSEMQVVAGVVFRGTPKEAVASAMNKMLDEDPVLREATRLCMVWLSMASELGFLHEFMTEVPKLVDRLHKERTLN